MVLTEMVDEDIVESENHNWYDPNPLGWASADWFDYYSISTGDLESSSRPINPAFKWHYSKVLPYRFRLQDGQTIEIDGQKFRVSGPFDEYGAFGQSVVFWRFLNLETFLYWTNGGQWSEYVHPGDVTLEFDINTRLLLKSDVLRNIYKNGDLTQYTIQYIDYLTGSNAYPVHPNWTTSGRLGSSNVYQPVTNSFDIPEESLRPVP